MNSQIKCPKCNEAIDNEKFDFRINDNAPWYKFKKVNMHCPHCGTKLKYDSRTQIYIYFLGAVFLLSIILVSVNILPIYSIIFAPFILATIFWKFRKVYVC